MSGIFRSDGLDSPISPNGGGGANWNMVKQACAESDAVESYDSLGHVITWVGIKEPERFTDPQAALIAIGNNSGN